MYIEWNKDGCPNNCGHCKKHNMICVYTDEGKHRDYKCALCGKAIASDETYNYKGFDFYGDCIDDDRLEVERMIKKVNSVYNIDIEEDLRDGVLERLWFK